MRKKRQRDTVYSPDALLSTKERGPEQHVSRFVCIRDNALPFSGLLWFDFAGHWKATRPVLEANPLDILVKNPEVRRGYMIASGLRIVCPPLTSGVSYLSDVLCFFFFPKSARLPSSGQYFWRDFWQDVGS